MAGRTGTQYPPFTEDEIPETLDVFVPDAFRTIQLEYTHNVELYGVNLRRYRLAQATLEPDRNFYGKIQVSGGCWGVLGGFGDLGGSGLWKGLRWVCFGVVEWWWVLGGGNFGEFCLDAVQNSWRQL